MDTICSISLKTQSSKKQKCFYSDHAYTPKFIRKQFPACCYISKLSQKTVEDNCKKSFTGINQFSSFLIFLSQHKENKKIQIITLRYFVTQIFPHNTTFCSYCSGQELILTLNDNHNPNLRLLLLSLSVVFQLDTTKRMK